MQRRKNEGSKIIKLIFNLNGQKNPRITADATKKCAEPSNTLKRNETRYEPSGPTHPRLHFKSAIIINIGTRQPTTFADLRCDIRKPFLFVLWSVRVAFGCRSGRATHGHPMLSNAFNCSPTHSHIPWELNDFSHAERNFLIECSFCV